MFNTVAFLIITTVVTHRRLTLISRLTCNDARSRDRMMHVDRDDTRLSFDNDERHVDSVSTNQRSGSQLVMRQKLLSKFCCMHFIMRYILQFLQYKIQQLFVFVPV